MGAGPAEVCRTCHEARVEAQAVSTHARAMRPWTGEHFAGRVLRERGGTTYAFTASGVRITRDGVDRDVVIQWAFGSGWQAITPVIEGVATRPVEHRVSWYRDGNRLGLTPGHDPTPVASLDDAMGIMQTEVNARRCYGCHSSDGIPGVYCQKCHGAGDAHVLKPVKGSIKRDRSVELCASCHRMPDATYKSDMPEVEDPLSVRFAPVGFTASKCYRKGKGLTCVSCHDPHGESRKVTVDAVCGSCHAVKKARGCPRTADCTGCHMPKSSPVAGLRFTDHRIR